MTHFLTAEEQCFTTIGGHDAAKRYLTTAINRSVLPHALLFHGPRGVGKSSMAFALAKAINCPNGGPQKCQCNICRKISESNSPDVLVVEPRGAAGQITLNGWKSGKDDPDNLQYYRFVDNRPLENDRKLVIIREADRLSVALANHLLKLIEEPPSYLLMILITNRRSAVLPTIRSRCAPVKFNPLQLEEMQQFAAESSEPMKSEDAAAMIKLSEGLPGLLQDLATGAIGGQRSETARLMQFFQQYGFISLFRVASEFQKSGSKIKQGENLEQLLNLLLAWFRDAMILKDCSVEVPDSLLMNSAHRAEIHRFAAKSSYEGLSAAADHIRAATDFIPRQTDKSYVLETLLLNIGHAIRK